MNKLELSKLISEKRWQRVSKNAKLLTEEQIDQYKDYLNWYNLVCKAKLSEKLIDQNWYRFDLTMKSNLVRFQKLSEAQIEKIFDSISLQDCFNYSSLITSVCLNQKLSEKFIRKFQMVLDFKPISFMQRLSEDFIEEFSNRLDWNGISERQYLSVPFIEKHFDKLNLLAILYSQILSETFIENHLSEIDRIGDSAWIAISSWQLLSEEFMNKYADKLDWRRIASNQKLSIQFIIKNLGRLNMKYLMRRSYLHPKARAKINEVYSIYGELT